PSGNAYKYVYSRHSDKTTQSVHRLDSKTALYTELQKALDELSSGLQRQWLADRVDGIQFSPATAPRSSDDVNTTATKYVITDLSRGPAVPLSFYQRGQKAGACQGSPDAVDGSGSMATGTIDQK
ncbi:hypothetical protein BaRGS_00036841, partial [Batillaria attramentaria]